MDLLDSVYPPIFQPFIFRTVWSFEKSTHWGRSVGNAGSVERSWCRSGRHPVTAGWRWTLRWAVPALLSGPAVQGTRFAQQCSPGFRGTPAPGVCILQIISVEPLADLY